MELENNIEFFSAKIKDQVKCISDSYKKTPILAIITIGYDKLSEDYFKTIRDYAEYTDISIMHFDYVDTVSENVVLRKIRELNKDEFVSGILIQLPIPKTYNLDKLLNIILKDKIVDFNQIKINSIFDIFDNYKIELDNKTLFISSNLFDNNLTNELFNKKCNVLVSKNILNEDIVIKLNNQEYNEFKKEDDYIIIDNNKIEFMKIVCANILKQTVNNYELQIKNLEK